MKLCCARIHFTWIQHTLAARYFCICTPLQPKAWRPPRPHFLADDQDDRHSWSAFTNSWYLSPVNSMYYVGLWITQRKYRRFIYCLSANSAVFVTETWSELSMSLIWFVVAKLFGTVLKPCRREHQIDIKTHLWDANFQKRYRRDNHYHIWLRTCSILAWPIFCLSAKVRFGVTWICDASQWNVLRGGWAQVWHPLTSESFFDLRQLYTLVNCEYGPMLRPFIIM